MTATLYSISYSPWSARARWALDYCGVSFQVREYVPMLGEPVLRARFRGVGGKMSVPALIDGDARIVGSREIAEHASEVGAPSEDLFPTHQIASIDRWHDLSERMLEAGRALVTARTARSDDAMLASIPFPMPGPLKPVGRGLARLGMLFLADKYEFDPSAVQRHEQIIRLGLIALRDAVQQSHSDFLLGGLTWADVAMVSAMQVAMPASNDVVQLDEAIRPMWTIDALSEEFADLTEWRDGVLRALKLS